MANQFNLGVQKFTSLVDRFNDKLTSYRLMLYFLLTLLGWAVAGSFLNEIPFSWHAILVSAGWLLLVCWVTNKLLAKFLDIPANKESDLISALILALILSPPKTTRDFAVLAAAGMAAMASKYIITLYKSHVFNPAALGAFIAGEIFHRYPSWWIGTRFMVPLLIIGGILVMRKMKRFWMVASFFAVFFLYQLLGNGDANFHLLWLEVLSTPLLFFGYVMLIEPSTSPSVARNYLPYAILVGLLYSVTKLKLSPESALLIGNLFAFVVSQNRRYEVKFIRKVKEAEGIFSYSFTMPKRFKFQPGQYLEWTVASSKTDSRGNRRYFTISSSPTEPALMLTAKQPEEASSFKKKLDALKPGDTMLAGHLAGGFTLPKDAARKIALLAGGVGVTPFRSMARHMIDSGEQRDAALLYSVNTPAELSFQPLFQQAEAVGLKPFYITKGLLDEAKIKTLLPDFAERKFYISGPYGFVNAVRASLLRLGVKASEIATDYFPGYGG